MKLGFVFMLYLCLGGGFAFGQSGANEVWTHTVEYNQWQEDTTVWYVNYRFWEGVTTKYELVLNFPRLALPIGYDEMEVFWGDGKPSEVLDFSTDPLQLKHTYAQGKFDLNIVLTERTGTLPSITYKHKVFNQDLSKCQVKVLNIEPKNRCMEHEQDTFWVRIEGTEDNPPQTTYSLTYNVSADLMNEITSQQDTLLEVDTTSVANERIVILKRPVGQYSLTIGFHMICKDEDSFYYLFNNTDQTPIYLYDKPELDEIFNFDSENPDPVKLCVGTELMACNDIYNNMYMDWQGFPSYKNGTQFYFTFYKSEKPEDPVWEVVPVTNDVSVVDSARLVFNTPGYYRLRVIAENFCGKDTLQTDSILNSPLKRLIAVYQSSDSLLSCLSNLFCIEDDPEIYFIDKAHRIEEEELPEYSFEITSADTLLTLNRDYRVISTEIFKEGRAVSFPEACDSTVVKLKIFQAGNFNVQFTRKHEVCGEISVSFTIHQGGKPELKEDVLVDSLIAYYGIGFWGGGNAAARCDTFCYTLQNFMESIDSNNLPTDSVAFVFAKGKGPKDTLIYREGVSQKYAFDSVTENLNYIELRAGNHCGWSESQKLNFYTYIRPDMQVLRNHLADNDTICAGTDCIYELAGTLPESYYIEVKYTKLDGNFLPIETPVQENQSSLTWTHRYEDAGVTEERIVLRNGMAYDLCWQEWVDTIFTVTPPSGFLYEDSLKYCDSETEITLAGLFGENTEGYRQAEWQWKRTDGDWNLAGSLPDKWTFTPSQNDTLYIRLSKSKGCLINDSLIFIPKSRPEFNLLKERDTVCVLSDIAYPLWDPDIIEFPGTPGSKVDLSLRMTANGVETPIVEEEGVGKNYQIALGKNSPDSLKIVYQAYNGEVTDPNSCKAEISRMFYIQKPYLDIIKTDTLDESTPGEYHFDRIEGYIRSAYVDETTYRWSQRGDLEGNILGGVYYLQRNDHRLDSLVFYLEGKVSSGYCAGEILKDSLIIRNPNPRIYGGFWQICDNSPYQLWGPGKAYGYFIEPGLLKWKILNEGEEWGKIQPDTGFEAYYTPLPGKKTALGDTVKIEMSYDGALLDTVYLKINPAPEWHLFEDTLIAKDRQMNVNRISEEVFDCKHYERLVLEKIGLNNDAVVKEDSVLDFSIQTSLDFGRNYEVDVKIKIKGLAGCAEVGTDRIKVLDLVNVQPRTAGMIVLCEGDSLKTASLFDYEVADQYTEYEWIKEGQDGAFNRDSSYYYVTGTGNRHKIKVITRKECTFYDGTYSGKDFRKEELASDYFKTYHNPGLEADISVDTLCTDQQYVEDVMNHWGIRVERSEYIAKYLRFNGLPLSGQQYVFSGNAGETDTVLITVDLGACRHMDWQTEDTVFLYKQRQMITGDFNIPGLCGNLWTTLDANTLVLRDYSDYAWSAEGADLDREPGDLIPKIKGKEEAVSGSITLTVYAGGGCPDEVLTKTFSRTILPEIRLEDQTVCPEVGNRISVPLTYVKKQEDIDRIEWKVSGSALPFMTTNKEDRGVDYVLTAEDVSKSSLGIQAEIFTNGACATVTSGDTMRIIFREIPEISVLQFAPEVCQGDTLQLADLAEIVYSDSISWEILSGAGRLQNNEFYFPEEGENETHLQISAKSGYGCNILKTEEITINIKSAPLPGEFQVSDAPCPGSELTFSAADAVENYTWNFADGSPEKEGNVVVHRYGEAGTYPVVCTVHYANACKRSRTEEVVVGALLEAGLKIVPETEDCRQLMRYVENTTQAHWTYARINWGDSEEWQTLEEGNPAIIGHRFNNDSTVVLTYPIQLIVGNACQEDTAYAELKVYPLQVKARIGISNEPAYGKCFGETWGFVNRSFGFGDSGYEALWSLEPGNAYRSTELSDTLVEHTFQKPGLYTVALTVRDKCNTDTVSRVIIVQGNDSLDFECSQALFCSGQGVGMEVIPEVRKKFSGFKWDFGDASAVESGKDSVFHVFHKDGEFAVKLRANALSEGYCPVEKIHSVHVNKTPEAVIRAVPAVRGCAPDTVDFVRQLQGDEVDDPAEQVYWNFRNGITASTNQVKGVVFETPGEYNVFLKIISGAGCTDSVSQPIITLETPVVGFTVSDTLFCTEDGIVRIGLENRTLEPEKNSYEWQYNGILFSRLYQPEPLTPASGFGKIEIKLTAYNNTTRCPATSVKEVVSSHMVKADFSVSPHEICEATPVHFESTSLHGEGAEWDMGDGTIQTESQFDYVYENPGVYSIKIVANNSEGCASEKTETVTVYPLPEAAFTWDKDNSLEEFPVDKEVDLPEVDNGGVRFTNLSDVYPKTWGDSLRFEWDFGDNTGISVQKSPYHRYSNNGVYEAVLKAITPYGCSNSVSDRISVSAVKGLYIPTAFAPAMPDDHMGEGGEYRGIARFQPKGVGLYTYKIQIYDAWGGCVWSSDKIEDGHPAEYWDGTFKGSPLPKGSYTWKVSATFIDGSVWDNNGGKMQGSLMLIR